MFFRAAACVLSLSFALPALAQQAPKPGAMSAPEAIAVMAGEDAGLARLADVHGWPGPRTVLANAEALNLAPDQVRIAENIEAEFEIEAREIALAWLAVEAELDEAFRSGRASKGKVQALTQQSGALRAELRALQLSAHIEMRPNLTRDQLESYSRLPEIAAARTGG